MFICLAVDVLIDRVYFTVVSDHTSFSLFRLLMFMIDVVDDDDAHADFACFK